MDITKSTLLKVGLGGIVGITHEPNDNNYEYGLFSLINMAQPFNSPGIIDGKLVTINGLRILGLGGCMKYGGDPKTSAPPFQYTEEQMSQRIRKLKWQLFRSKGFDMLVTHSPAQGVCDGADVCHTGFSSLRTLVERWNPPIMIHGHMHMGFGRGKRFVMHQQTKVIDAFEYYILEI